MGSQLPFAADHLTATTRTLPTFVVLPAMAALGHHIKKIASERRHHFSRKASAVCSKKDRLLPVSRQRLDEKNPVFGFSLPAVFDAWGFIQLRVSLSLI